MADENATVPEGEVETEVTEETEPEQAADSEDNPEPEGEQPEGEENQEEIEEEVEYDLGGGQKLKVKANATAKDVFEQAQKAFKDVEGNVTRKFQEVAERSKSLEAREKAVEKIQSLTDDSLNTYSRGLSVKQEIEQLQRVDLNALWQSNPDQARRVSDAISAKQAEFQSILNRVSTLEGQINQAQATEVARRMDEGRAIIAKAIPDFETKVLPELSAYMIQQGLPKEEVPNWPRNPLYTRMAHKAMLFDKMQAQAKQAAKPKPTPAQPMKPMQGKGGSVAKDPSKMTASEMAKHLGLPG